MGRWLRRLGVTLVLLAPVAGVLFVAWPEAGAESLVEGGAISAGDDVDGTLGVGSVMTYDFVGTGRTITVGVHGGNDFTGGTLDTKLTVVDEESGEQLADVDDAEPPDLLSTLNPRATLDVEEGRHLRFEVRGFHGAVGSFTIYVDNGTPGHEEPADGSTTVTTAIGPPAIPPAAPAPAQQGGG